MQYQIKQTIQIGAFLIGVGYFLIACDSKNASNEQKDTTQNPKTEEKIEKTADNTLTQAEIDAGWKLLFDGKDTQGWRSFNQEKLNGWVVEAGTFKALGKGGDTGGDIVYGAEPFENFELVLEWKIAKGGNSGIFYHVQEGKEYKAAYETAPEYQLIDDLDFPEKLEDWQKLGADYAMYPADATKKIVKKAGEWNSTRIVFTPQKAEYWLNGEKVVSFEPWSAEWNKRKNEGKWKEFPNYGLAKKGLIGFQDHGSEVWFKNIKLKKL
jgi:hypothetical protein